MKRCFRYLKPWVPTMILGLIIKFIGTIMDLLLPWALAYIIDTAAPKKDLKEIVFFGILMLVFSVVAVTTNISANRRAALVAKNTVQALRHDLFGKIMYLSRSDIDRFTISSLESRMTSDTYHLNNMLGMMQRIGIRAPILLIGGICITFMLEPVLTLVLLGVLPFMIIITVYVSKKGISLVTSQQKSVDAMVRVVRENISGIRVIKALSKTEYEKNRFDEANAELVTRETKASVTMAITTPVMNLLLNCGLAAVILAGAYRVNGGVTGTGTIIAFLSYFTIILNALLMVTRIFVMYSRGAASAGRIGAVLEAKSDRELIEAAKKVCENHIEFNNVSFSYYKKRNNVSNINFKLKKGESLGIIGATGSGKSTIASLLMRFYDIDSGEILIDGRDIRSIPDSELHRMFGVVHQNDTLFADTIKNNIDFGRGLNDDEIAEAIRVSQAEEFISALPDRENHMLSQKGTNLSGGQKQRVLLARALAGSPSILIFDDSSSALDYKTDASLRGAIKEYRTHSTCVIIAQRISSIKHCEHIIMLDDGKIIGSGTHDELIKSCPEYAAISKMQMGGAEDAGTKTGERTGR